MANNPDPLHHDAAMPLLVSVLLGLGLGLVFVDALKGWVVALYVGLICGSVMITRCVWGSEIITCKIDTQQKKKTLLFGRKSS